MKFEGLEDDIDIKNVKFKTQENSKVGCDIYTFQLLFYLYIMYFFVFGQRTRLYFFVLFVSDFIGIEC